MKSHIPNPIAYVEQHFGISLTHVSGCEYRSLNGCPRCGDDGKGTDSDRFRLFADEHACVWCRKCGYQQFVDKLANNDNRLTDIEKRVLQIEAEQRRQSRVQKDQSERIQALEYMARCRDHLIYHSALDDTAIQWWKSRGVTEASIEKYQLGFCRRCPTDTEHRSSFTIPIYDHTQNQLTNIRHRLNITDTWDRYRPHRKHVGRQVYQSHLVADASELIMVEGCVKTIVLAQETFPAIGIQGAHGFDLRWLPHFKDTRILYIAFDPDAMEPAYKLGQNIAKASSIDVRIVSLPTKPDDFFWLFSGTANMFNEYLRYAQRVR